MKSAVLVKPPVDGMPDADRLRALLLVRIAGAGDGIAKSRLVSDLRHGGKPASYNPPPESPRRQRTSRLGNLRAARSFLSLGHAHFLCAIPAEPPPSLTAGADPQQK